MRLAAFQSVVSDRLVRATGSSLPPRRRCFQRDLRFSPATVPRVVAHASSSSRTLHSPSETPVRCLPRAFRHRAPSLGFTFPLRDLSRQHRWTGFPHPAPSLLDVSHALEGLLCLRPCGFISPRCHVQGSPTRNSNSHRPDASSTPSCPLVVSDRLLPPVARRLHIQSHRPQGFSLYKSSGTEVTVFSRHLSPLPRRSFLLQVLPLVEVRAPSRPFRSWPCRKTRRCRALR
jgi:hypothetical protein